MVSIVGQIGSKRLWLNLDWPNPTGEEPVQRPRSDSTAVHADSPEAPEAVGSARFAGSARLVERRLAASHFGSCALRAPQLEWSREKRVAKDLLQREQRAPAIDGQTTAVASPTVHPKSGGFRGHPRRRV